MKIARLRIEGFRGISRADFDLHDHTVVIGPNGCGKSTLIDALSLVLGRGKMVRPLTEHDFTGGDPQPEDRITIVATLSGFDHNDPERHGSWFRLGRSVPKWIDGAGTVHPSEGPGRMLCSQIGFAARFDHDELTVEQLHYFFDDDTQTDPFLEESLQRFPLSILSDIGYFVLPARRSWESVTSFNSELFRKTVSNSGGIPASAVLAQRDRLRVPDDPVEESLALQGLVADLNAQLARLMPSAPQFKLRVTAGDCEAVLQALLPHYMVDGVTLPASRHGTGLVSLQSFLLLLAIGRARKKNGLSFVLALEEPELHLAPGLQVRLVAEAMGIASQTICVTHSPRAACIFKPEDVLVAETQHGGPDSGTARTLKLQPFCSRPLALNSTNNDRKLFLQNRARVIEALMQPAVLVPEGRFDAEWLARLAAAGEELQKNAPFSAVYGVIPTENAAVIFTAEALARLRSRIVALVDGDAAGAKYALELGKLPGTPPVVLQWPKGWAIEDVVCWIIDADAAATVSDIQRDLGSDWSLASLDDLRTALKTTNDSKNGTLGLKENVIAHDAIIAAIMARDGCRSRVGILLDKLVDCAQASPRPTGQVTVTLEVQSP